MENKKTSRFSWGKFAVIFAFFALFVLGLAAGLFWNVGKPGGNDVMTEGQCDRLNSSINNLVFNIRNSEDISTLKEMHEIYSEYCADAAAKKSKSKPEPEKTAAMVVRNCDAVEMAIKAGRPELENPDYNSSDSMNYTYRAESFATLAARGCPENSEKYRELALRDIEIARVLSDDKFYDDGKTLELIEAYKKLDMKRDAEMVIDKMKQLADPAIDFIMRVEKIINE